jgi:hypothetical protein
MFATEGFLRWVDRDFSLGDSLPAHHCLAGRYAQPIRRENVRVALQEIVADVPESWLGAGDRWTLLDTLRDIIDLYIQRSG